MRFKRAWTVGSSFWTTVSCFTFSSSVLKCCVDIFFNTDGFHNHIAHHLCTLYALGASPHAIQQQYDLNAEHQRPPEPIDAPIISELHDPARFKTYLGNERYYNDFLHFFKQEMDKKGWQAVLNEYLFSRDERADDMLVRMYAGMLFICLIGDPSYRQTPAHANCLQVSCIP